MQPEAHLTGRLRDDARCSWVAGQRIIIWMTEAQLKDFPDFAGPLLNEKVRTVQGEGKRQAKQCWILRVFHMYIEPVSLVCATFRLRTSSSKCLRGFRQTPKLFSLSVWSLVSLSGEEDSTHHFSSPVIPPRNRNDYQKHSGAPLCPSSWTCCRWQTLGSDFAPCSPVQHSQKESGWTLPPPGPQRPARLPPACWASLWSVQVHCGGWVENTLQRRAASMRWLHRLGGATVTAIGLCLPFISKTYWSCDACTFLNKQKPYSFGSNVVANVTT